MNDPVYLFVDGRPGACGLVRAHPPNVTSGAVGEARQQALVALVQTLLRQQALCVQEERAECGGQHVHGGWNVIGLGLILVHGKPGLTVLDSPSAGVRGRVAPAQREGGSVTVVWGREPEQVSRAPVLYALVELTQDVRSTLTDPLDDHRVPDIPAGHNWVNHVQVGVWH